MKCSKCGNEVAVGNDFCSNCGNKLESNQVQNNESVNNQVVNNTEVTNNSVESNVVGESATTPVVENNVVSENVASPVVENNIADSVAETNTISNTTVINNEAQTSPNVSVQQNVQVPVQQAPVAQVAIQDQSNQNVVNAPVSNNQSSKLNKKNIIIVASVVLVLIIAVVAIVSLLFKGAKLEVKIVYSSDNESAPYYIEDESVIIDNSDNHTTTKPKTTVAKTSTTKIAYSTVPIQNTTITTRKTTSTTRPTTTTTRVIVTTTKPQNTTRPTVQVTQPRPTTSTTITPITETPTTTIPVAYEPEEPTTSTTTTTTTTSTTTTTTTSTTTTSPIVDANKVYDRTVMIYMVGSNLESEDAAASKDILEMAGAYSDDNTNIYVYTGGSTYWHISSISSSTNMISLVKNNYIYPMIDMGNKNTGEAASLADFINIVDDNTSTNYYDLILWDHGMGPVYGFGHDEKTGDFLFLAEILNALANTSFNKDRKLEFIGFDACLMSSVEVAYYLRNYTDYLIASEETEFGYGWDYNSFDNASKLSTVELAKRIIDDFANANIEYMNARPNTFSPYTLTLTDLTKVDNVVEVLNSNFKKLTSSIDSQYEQLAYLRLNSIEFGQFTNSSSYDLVDLYHFSEKIDMNDIKNAINDTVIYSNTNLKNAHGLSVFFPYTEGDKNETEARLNYVYKGFTEFNDYYEFISKFVEVRYGNSRKTVDLSKQEAKYNSKSKQLSLKVNDNIVNNIARGYYIIFEKFDNGYMPVYRGNNLNLDGNNLVADYNNRMLTVSDTASDEIGTIPVYESKRTNKGTEYMSPVVLMDFTTDEFLVDGGTAKFYVEGDSMLFQGIIPDDDDSQTGVAYENKKVWQLEDWQSVQFANFRYNILDDKGKYTLDWKSLDTKYLFEVTPKKEKVTFKVSQLDSSKEYYAVICIQDFQGNITTTDLIPIK